MCSPPHGRRRRSILLIYGGVDNANNIRQFAFVPPALLVRANLVSHRLMIDLIWNIQPAHFRAFVIIAAVAVLVSMWRTYHLVTALYLPRSKPAGFQEKASTDCTSLQLAQRLLANTIAYNQLATVVSETGETRIAVLEFVDLEFQRLWDECHAVTESIRRTSIFLLLLSSLIASYGAEPTYNDLHQGSRLNGFECITLTLFYISIRLAIGLSVCTLLFAIQGVFQRVLADRRRRCAYFTKKLKVELSVPG